jgi:hypothetical protein
MLVEGVSDGTHHAAIVSVSLPRGIALRRSSNDSGLKSNYGVRNCFLTTSDITVAVGVNLFNGFVKAIAKCFDRIGSNIVLTLSRLCQVGHCCHNCLSSLDALRVIVRHLGTSSMAHSSEVATKAMGLARITDPLPQLR